MDLLVIHLKNANTAPIVLTCCLIDGEFTIRCDRNFSPNLLKHKLATDQESKALITSTYARLCQSGHLREQLSILDKLIIIELHRVGLLGFLQDLCAVVHHNQHEISEAPISAFDPLAKLCRCGFYKTVIRSLPYPNQLTELTSCKGPASARKYENGYKYEPGNNAEKNVGNTKSI